MTFFWWDDAMALARELARDTQIRHKVTAAGGGWAVEIAADAVLEPCS